MAPAWVFSLSSRNDGGQLQSTPIVTGGCAFVASTSAVVYALNATTGAVVWQTALTAHTAGLGGAVVGSLAINSGAVIALVNQQGDGVNGPYVEALDQHSGRVLWTSAAITSLSGYYSNASPQVFNGVAFVGFSPPEGDPTGQGGFALLDARSGRILTATPTISPADQALGYAGGGIWSTPAFDPTTGFAYVGAGNPYSKTIEDAHTNAILKVDLRRNSPTFGAIVASYKGNVDQYTQVLQALSQTPVCPVTGGLPNPLDDPACGQLDLDFGAAPNLFTENGKLVVGDLQKSGVYHVADAATMKPVWSTIVGATCQACNAASTAVANGAVYGESTPFGIEFSLLGTSGAQRWATPVGDGVHYQATSFANGIAYTFDTAGFLDAFDSTTGALVLRRPMTADAGAPTASLTSGGIAIAYHTLFVAASEGGPMVPPPASNGFLIAYRNGSLGP
jgi:outer membrane protein assembly factor BamB